MANPASRQDLIDYAKRQLGYPVLEINLADEQIDDLMDDAIQMYQNRHMDGVELMYLKHKITQNFIDAIEARGDDKTIGITTTTATASITGIGTTTFSYEENQNFIQVPDTVIGVEKIYKIDNRVISTTMFNNLNYQFFMSDFFYFTGFEMLTYAMTRSYLADVDFLLNPSKQIRYNRRQNRLYLDTDAQSLTAGDYLLIQCYRVLNPNDFTKVYNDPFLKRYFTALMKRQWGQNLIKFRGVKLPGGIELNGREIYEDAQQELKELTERMPWDYELPPMDMIG